MKTLKLVLKPFALLLLAMVVFSCNKETSDSSSLISSEEEFNQVASDMTIGEYLESNSEFSSFAYLLNDVNILDEIYDESSNLTVFAPNDDAFTSLLNEYELSSIDEIDNEILLALLSTHVVNDSLPSSQITNGMSISTLGSTLAASIDPIRLIDKNRRVGELIDLDISTSNGIIHIIDEVMVPRGGL